MDTTVVWGVGLVVLVLVALPVTAEWVGSLVTVAHEGGHIVVGLLTGHAVLGFGLTDGDNAATQFAKLSWGPGRILTVLAGYTTPPVVGLAGAALVASGRSWSVLWVAVILLLGAWSQFRGALAGLVLLLAGGGIGYAAVEGSTAVQAGLAVGLVWLLLLGGVRAAVTLSRADGSDPAILAGDTLVPRLLWHGVFVGVALLCLWFGGRRLVGL